MLCCLHGWRRVVCYLDNLNHTLLRRFAVRPLCDLHDDYLSQEMAEWSDDQDVRAHVSRLWAEDWDSAEDATYD